MYVQQCSCVCVCVCARASVNFISVYCTLCSTDGYILFTGANLIGDGCETLEQAFTDPNTQWISRLVVPILGAIPDGMIILMSGR